MKVLLVFAPPMVKPKLGELSEGRYPPLGLLYLAAYLKGKLPDVKVRVIDGLVKGYDKVITDIVSFKPDILGVSYYTPVANSAYQLINEIKGMLAKITVIGGGPHATALPKEAMEKSKADIVVLGEGEVTFFELVKMFKQKSSSNIVINNFSNIDGIIFRQKGDHYYQTLPRKPIENLDSIPFPERHLLGMTDYKGWYLSRGKKEAVVMFSRGCPYNCSFCSNKVWKVSKPWVRFRSPKNIIDEIEDLVSTYGINEIYDCSDEFNNNIEHALSICSKMRERKFKIYWKTSVRAHPLPERLVKMMAETGCWYVMMGVESGNNETLKGIKKGITTEQVESACRILKKYGIKVQGLFMQYNVWEENGYLRYENTEMVKKTFRFISELLDQKLLDYVGWSITTPYPGSKLYDIALKHNLIRSEFIGSYDRWLSEDAQVMRLPGITIKDLVRTKTMGAVLRGKLILKQRDFKLKDLGWMSKKVLKILVNEAKSFCIKSPLA
jgi:radical SAM superfamily enzyme YgiQ (UPF0313 family)